MADKVSKPSLAKKLLKDQRVLLAIVLVMIVAVISVINPKFIALSNIVAIFQQICVLGILTMAMSILLISGGIDLSIGNILALAQRAGVELVALPCTKEELGAALGRNSCAVAALTDKGLAAAVAADLAQTNGDLEPLAQSLAQSSRGKQTKPVGRRRTPRNAN